MPGSCPDLLDVGLVSPVRVGSPVEFAVSDRAWLQAMLDAEAALVRAQAALGTVPVAAARSIATAARAEHFDLRELAVAAREAANPVVALARLLSSVVAEHDPAAADYVHRGSTSQDILDTGLMLIAQRSLRLLSSDLDRAVAALDRLADEHRDTLMIGRTMALHAVPTTFGLKAAGWAASIGQARDRAVRVADELPVSLGGAAGTLAGYLEYARLEHSEPTELAGYPERLGERFAAETGLRPSMLPWHSRRAPIADLGSVLAFVTGALGKLAVDVQSLTRTEVGEVAEAVVVGRGRSSAMPHKRNPVLSTLVRSAALQVPVLATGLMQALLAEDERSAGGWHAEWLLLRECLRLAGGAAHTAAELAEGLLVYPERMRANVGLTDSRIVSERIAAVLTPVLGKARAQQLWTQCAEQARDQRRPLSAVLADQPALAERFSPGQLAELCAPEGYLGAAASLVERYLR